MNIFMSKSVLIFTDLFWGGNRTMGNSGVYEGTSLAVAEAARKIWKYVGSDGRSCDERILWSDAVKQEKLVRQKPDIIVSTPSRLWDFLGRPRVKLTLEVTIHEKEVIIIHAKKE